MNRESVQKEAKAASEAIRERSKRKGQTYAPFSQSLYGCSESKERRHFAVDDDLLGMEED